MPINDLFPFLQLCGDDKLCLFDVAATGDLNVGATTREIVEEQEMQKEIFQSSNQL